MSAPPLAPIPPANTRLELGPDEWKASLDAWLSLSEFHLRLPAKTFAQTAATEASSLHSFLRSFYHEAAHPLPGDETLRIHHAQRLQRICFMLVHRMSTSDGTELPLSNFDFLADLCHVHIRNVALSQLLMAVWKRKDEALQKSLQKRKTALIKELDQSKTTAFEHELRQLAPIMRASADCAALFMTGSDFLDALVSAYSRCSSPDERKAIVLTTFVGLQALVVTESPNFSILSDHLYSLKAQADGTQNFPSSLLADVVTNTPLVSKLRHVVAEKASDRLLKLLDTLDTYRMPSIAQPRRRPRRKVDKGKGKASQADGEIHIHRMSLVTQVQDLFPDLGSGFVMRLFDEYGDDVEQVTAHLLDDSLAPHLREIDRTEEVAIQGSSSQAQIDRLEPQSMPQASEPFVPQRKNIFDDDEFDRLQFDTSRLHIGKRAELPTKNEPNKAAILSALAAFDSDDDERDDTYDAEDVGGTVDSAHPDGEPGPLSKTTHDPNDMALFTTYKSSPELFGRTFNIRRGQPRHALKAETGMTDEAIEGWAIMLQREPARLRKLEEQLGTFDGRQNNLGRTAYRESAGNTETEDSDTPGAGRGGFRGRGRGFGGGGRGRGESVAGPSNAPETAQAQRRKEASKGSRANHNRRDQRARKVARAGFPG